MCIAQLNETCGMFKKENSLFNIIGWSLRFRESCQELNPALRHFRVRPHQLVPCRGLFVGQSSVVIAGHSSIDHQLSTTLIT